MSTKEMIELALAALVAFALTGAMIAGTIVLYLEGIHPHLQEMREDRAARRVKKDKITGIHFGVAIEREAPLKDGPEMGYRRQA